MKVRTSAPNATATKAGTSRARRRTSPYMSMAESKALMASSLAARTERLHAGDMLTTQEAAALAGTTRVTINAWIAKGRAIGLTQTRRGYRMPKWQFEPAIWSVLAGLAQALGTTDGWSLLSFLESPSGGLNGISPRQAIEQGAASWVLELAGAEG